MVDIYHSSSFIQKPVHQNHQTRIINKLMINSIRRSWLLCFNMNTISLLSNFYKHYFKLKNLTDNKWWCHFDEQVKIVDPPKSNKEFFQNFEFYKIKKKSLSAPLPFNTYLFNLRPRSTPYKKTGFYDGDSRTVTVFSVFSYFNDICSR